VHERTTITPYLGIRCLALIFVVLIAFFSPYCYGQEAGIKGRIRDTILNKDCPLAVVAILGSDSTILLFARSRRDGSFSFKDLPARKIHLLISHPSYSDYVDSFTIEGNSFIDLGTLALTPRADTLQAVIVTPKTIPMHMKGDTLEYNTANVKLKLNATVEELLSRLPGVQVDENGGIIVNGQKVQRLLIDGEDFFGGDPTIVTRNFNADMIAKVQVLDKKSSHAEFTGIDDGQKTKTINLTLKEDSKKGYFSKAEVGADPQGIYDVNALLGSFKGKRQFAALGIVANNGATGFNGAIDDMGSNLDLSGDANDALNASAGGGIPRIVGGAVHYANNWNGNDDHIAGNYQYGGLTTHPYSTSLTEQILPDSIYMQNQASSSMNSQVQHALNADYDWVPDSLSAFRFSIGGMTMQGHNQFSSLGSSSFNDTLVNNSLQNISSQVQSQNFRGSVMWRKHGRRKKGHAFAVIAGVAKQDNSTNGHLYAISNFYQPSGNLLRADTTDQMKLITSPGYVVNGNLNFTEPLWKGAILGFRYDVSFNRNLSLMSTYNRGNGKYQDLVDSLSNHYKADVLMERSTINLEARQRRLSYTIGGDILHYINRQTDLLKDSASHYGYSIFTPRASMFYNPTDKRAYSFDYSGTSNQPSIGQLQPVQNNTNPLHIVLGNPDLHASFSHHFSLNFTQLKPVNLNFGINYDFTTNAISTRTYTDSLGRQVSQAVNVNGSENLGLNISTEKLIRAIALNVNYSFNFSYGQSVNYVNTLLARNDNYNAGADILISKYVADKYNFRIKSNAEYSYFYSSASPGVVTQYWTQNHNAYISVFPLPRLEFNTNCRYVWRQKTSFFDKNNATIFWNAGLSKIVWHNQLTLRWEINNILDQNSGIGRSMSGNTITQNTSNVVGRYWMLTAVYRFINHGKFK
jgi:Outer membrane protein beta-barrel family